MKCKRVTNADLAKAMALLAHATQELTTAMGVLSARIERLERAAPRKPSRAQRDIATLASHAVRGH